MNFRFDTPVSRLACVAFTTLVVPIASAQPDPSLTDVSLPRLQDMVARCDLLAPKRQPQTATEAFCATAADELRRREFDGDGERLLAWWRERRAGDTRPAAQPARPAAAAAAAVVEPALARATPAQLKSAYLQCERQAQSTLLDFATAARCSLIYEELKRRVFDGDFERVLAWWREQRAAEVAAARSGTAAEASPR